MPLDGFMTGYLAAELNTKLADARISKIYQPAAHKILFELYAPQLGAVQFLFNAESAFSYAGLTSLRYENPKNPSAFCMLLRKHLSGGKIKSVQQNDHDRILTFTIEQADEIGDIRLRHAIAELTGKHVNVILTDEEHIILDSLKRVDETKSSQRQILPKLRYQMPLSDKLNPKTMRQDAFLHAMKSVSLPPRQALIRVLEGAGTDYAHYICTQLSAFAADSLSDECLVQAYALIKASLTPPQQYYLFAKDDLYCDFYFANIADKETKSTLYSSVVELCSVFFDWKSEFSAMREKKQQIFSALNTQIKRSESKLKKMRKELLDCDKKEIFNQYGQLLLSYSHKIPPGANDYEDINLFDEKQPLIRIPLNPHHSVFDNAQNYFKKYRKLKNAEMHLTNQIRLTEETVTFLNDQLYYIQQSTRLDDLEDIAQLLEEEGFLLSKTQRKKQNVSQPHHFLSTDGFDIYVGKNDKQNDYLTHKFAKKQDIWLHTKNIAGSHVIIKTFSKQVPNNTLLEAAQLSVFFSKARGGENIPVDYTTIAYVKKIHNAPIGKVTYSHYRTLYITPDETLIKSLKTI